MTDYEIADSLRRSRRKFVCIKSGVEVESSPEEQKKDFEEYGLVAMEWYYWLIESKE